MKYRIKKIRTSLGINQRKLCEMSGLSQSYLSLLETGARGKAPSTDVLLSIADALGVKVSDLFDDAQPVAVAGKVGAGASVPLVDAYAKGDGLYHVACPSELSGKNIVGVEVEGDSMFPIYRGGDVLFYSRDALGVPTEAIGAICVCEDESGQGWVKLVKVGAEKGLFSLISINPQAESMHDVRLKWASPVRLHWPRDLVEQM